MADDDKTITVRLSEGEREEIKEAAWLRRVTTQEWTRSILLANARATKQKLGASPSAK
jgi:hypothetical protein